MNGSNLTVFSWPSIGFFCLFGVFIFYQRLHIQQYRGASAGFLSLLVASTTLGGLTGVAYLIYYGWAVNWWAPLIIFLMGLAAAMVGVVLEQLVGAFAWSMTAFIGWPVAAYLMFAYIPSVG